MQHKTTKLKSRLYNNILKMAYYNSSGPNKCAMVILENSKIKI